MKKKLALFFLISSLSAYSQNLMSTSTQGSPAKEINNQSQLEASFSQGQLQLKSTEIVMRGLSVSARKNFSLDGNSFYATAISLKRLTGSELINGQKNQIISTEASLEQRLGLSFTFEKNLLRPYVGLNLGIQQNKSLLFSRSQQQTNSSVYPNLGLEVILNKKIGTSLSYSPRELDVGNGLSIDNDIISIGISYAL